MKTTTDSTIEKGTETKREFAFADNPPIKGEGTNLVSLMKVRSESKRNRHVSAQSVPTQTWEYCILEINGIHSDPDREERAGELNKLGAVGWDLVGTTSGGSQYHEYLIFKRPKT